MSNKSKNVIAEALMRLMEENTFDEITISQICENTDLVRKTFYNNFDSKENVVEYIAEKLIKVYHRMVAEEGAFSQKEMAYLYFCFGEKYRKVLSVFIKNNLFYLIRKQFDSFFPSTNALITGDNLNDMSDDELMYAFAFNSAGVNRLLEIWIETGLKQTPREMGNLYAAITKSEKQTI